MPQNSFGAAIGQAISELILLVIALLKLPFWLAGLLFRWRARWRMVPLEIKSHIRLRTATFGLVVLIGASVFRVIPYDNSVEVWGALGLAGYLLLILAVGLIGLLFAERWQLRFDPMSIWWWGVCASACVALLVYSGIAQW
jgi:hypothetical protein